MLSAIINILICPPISGKKRDLYKTTCICFINIHTIMFPTWNTDTYLWPVAKTICYILFSLFLFSVVHFRRAICNFYTALVTVFIHLIKYDRDRFWFFERLENFVSLIWSRRRLEYLRFEDFECLTLAKIPDPAGCH